MSWQERQTESLKLAKDPVAALALKDEMSRISERYYRAGWLIDLEFRLWPMLFGTSRKFGLGEVTEGEIMNLVYLSKKAGGWWRWWPVEDGDVNEPVDSGEIFVPMAEWGDIYAGPLGANHD